MHDSIFTQEIQADVMIYDGVNV